MYNTSQSLNTDKLKKKKKLESRLSQTQHFECNRDNISYTKILMLQKEKKVLKR